VPTAAPTGWSTYARIHRPRGRGRRTVVFADFEHSRRLPGPLAEVPVPGDSRCAASGRWSAMPPTSRRAWQHGCHPGQDRCPDADRSSSAVVGGPAGGPDQARIGTVLTAGAIPAMAGQLEARLSGEPGPSSADLRRAMHLLPGLRQPGRPVHPARCRQHETHAVPGLIVSRSDPLLAVYGDDDAACQCRSPRLCGRGGRLGRAGEEEGDSLLVVAVARSFLHVCLGAFRAGGEDQQVAHSDGCRDGPRAG
jgi:hypothetical protein